MSVDKLPATIFGHKSHTCLYTLELGSGPVKAEVEGKDEYPDSLSFFAADQQTSDTKWGFLFMFAGRY